MTEQGNQQTDPLLSLAAIARLLNVNRQTLWRWRKNPALDFPQPYQLAPNTPRWRSADLERWLASRRTRGPEEGVSASR